MRFVLTLVAVSVGLVACGGSDDNEGSGTGPNPSAMQATLTSTNYVAVAQEALSSNAYLLDASSFVTGAQVSDPQVFVRFGQDQLTKVSGWFAKAPVQAVGAVYKETEQCDGGGTLAIEVNDRNNNEQVDAGDSLSLTANSCRVDGEVLNGQLGFTFNRLSGNLESYPYELSATMRFTNLSAQSASARVVGNGSLTLDVKATSYSTQTTKLSTSSFSSATTYNGSTYNQSLQNYETNLQTSPAGNSIAWTSSVNGTLTSSSFDSKSVRIATTTPFVRLDSQAYPATGAALITGAAGAKIRVTAASATTLTIDLDADGNGSYETSVNKLWSEML